MLVLEVSTMRTVACEAFFGQVNGRVHRVTRRVPADVSRELLERPPVDAWAACASIWSRVFVLSGSGWAREPKLSETMRTAFALAMQRSIGTGALPSAERHLSAFAAFGLEDDGSAEWNYMLDLIGMITPVLSGQDVGTCLDAALRF